MNIRHIILAALLALAAPSQAQTITALPAASALSGTELLEVVQSGSKKATAAQIKTLVIGAGSVSVASSKTLTVSNTLTFSGTDSSTLNVGAGGTLGALSFVTPGANVATALGVAVGSDGAFVTRGGNAGTPSALVCTNCTGMPPAGVTGTAAILTGNAFTGSNSTTLSIAATSTDGHILQNTTAAAAGAQQWSPRLRLTGQGWKTNATAASQSTDWILENQPVQGAANPTSLLTLSYGVNGGAYSRQFAFTSANGSRIYGDNATPYLELNSSNGSSLYYGTVGFVAGAAARIDIGGTSAMQWTANDARFGGVGTLSWAPVGSGASSAADLILSHPAAATLQFGAADVAGAPVAQFTRVQSASGVSNTAGANWTLQASAGTGDQAGGSLIFQVAPLGSSGSTKNAYATALTIAADANKTATFAGVVQLVAGSISTPTLRIGSSNFGFYSDGGATLTWGGSGNAYASIGNLGISILAGSYYRWSTDSSLSRISAGVIGVGTGTAGSFAGRVKLTSAIAAGVAVGSLNASPTTGEIQSVTDALAPAVGSIVAAGGAATALVWWNGAAWTVIGI